MLQHGPAPFGGAAPTWASTCGDGELEAQRCAARDERRAAEVREQESAAHVATLTQKNATMRVDVKTLQGKLAAAEQALAAAQGRAAALEETLAKQALSSQNSDAEMAALDEATRGRRMSGSGTVMSPTASQGRGAGGVDLTDTQGRLSLSPTSCRSDALLFGEKPSFSDHSSSQAPIIAAELRRAVRICAAAWPTIGRGSSHRKVLAAREPEIVDF